MVEKRYKTDKNKSRSRIILKNTIEDTILKYKKPTEVQVVCLPGIDAQEIIEVYDQLLIPRKNIIGIERESTIFHELNEKKLGIQLFQGSINDYINSKKKLTIDVVSFDYTGAINIEQIENLRNLNLKQTLDKFILHTANSVRRDSNSYPLYSQSYLLLNKNFNYLDIESVNDLITKDINFHEKKDKKTNMVNEKSEAYSNFILSAFSRKNSKTYEKIVKYFFNNKVNNSNLLKSNLENFIFTDNYFSQLIFNQNNYLADSYAVTAEGQKFNGILSVQFILEYLTQLMSLELKEYFLDSKINNENEYITYFSKVFFEALFVTISDKYFLPEYTRKYAYTSEDSTPMIGDINFMTYYPESQRKAKLLTASFNFPNKLEKKSKNKKILTLFKNYCKENKKDLNKVNSIYHPKNTRVHLGSSSKPLLNKTIFLKEINSGLSNNEIKLKYRGWKNKEKSFAAWRAHNTMGTYKKQQEKI